MHIDSLGESGLDCGTILPQRNEAKPFSRTAVHDGLIEVISRQTFFEWQGGTISKIR